MRLPVHFAVSSGVLLGLLIGICGLASPASLMGQTNVTTWHNDNARTGQNLTESILTPAKVNSSSFGVRFEVPVDGKVDAQPLYISAFSIPGKGTHNIVFAATEHDSVYAFDADTGKILWQVSLLKPGETPSDPRNCNQVSPEIGITATPVIDAGKHFLYVAAMSKDASGHYYQRLHALWLTSGADEYGSPVTVQATAPGNGDNGSNGTVTFDPAQYKERPGLLLVGDTLYTSWSSHCDIRPYTGWMLSYSTGTGAQTGVFNFVPNGSEAAPWNAGAGPAADAAGNVFIALGNGTFDTQLNAQGFPSLGDYGNAVVKLNMLNGTLQATDYWTMYDSNAESGVDTDLGSGGVMLLPGQRDSKGAVRQLAVAAGKDANLYMMDQTNLGKFDASSNGTLYQELGHALSNGEWSSPAYFNGHVYYGSVGSVLRSFDVNDALLSSSPSSSTPESFTYPGTTPSVSAFGNLNGIVWAVENSNPAVLHAFDASNLGVELYNSNQAGSSRDHFGNGNKFITPTIANGKVYVGTQNSVAVFGMLPQGTPPLADGDYNITNGASKLLLTDYLASPDPSTEIIQFTPYGGQYQTWFLSSQGNGYYLIQNAATGLFLSAPESTSESALGTTSGAGLAAHHAEPPNSDAELWSLTSAGAGYMIRNKSTGSVLENPGSTPNPSGIQLQAASSGMNQSWSIQAAK